MPKAIWISAIVFCSCLSSVAAGPDIVVGYIDGCEQLGRIGPVGSGIVGIGCDTTACNRGDASLRWRELPDTRHPIITLNLYRWQTVSGADRFEQVGQSWVKHARNSDQVDECGLGCIPSPEAELGPGCSDIYVALQLIPCVLGPRSIIHPFTGELRAGDDLGSGGDCANNYPSADHRDHVHDSISHRLQIGEADLLHPGAVYFAEAQYLTSDEFIAREGAQFNNVAYRQYEVGSDGRGNYQFNPVSGTFSESSALDAWAGATQVIIEPDSSSDGRTILAYKVTQMAGGDWHYEYAAYNMNLDRAIYLLSVPVPEGVGVTNIGFHAPPAHSSEPHADNYSDLPWDASNSQAAVTWSTEPYASNPLANAIRWGTLYNFRFDANAAPQPAQATVGFFKTGDEMAVSVLAPAARTAIADCNQNGLPDDCDVQCGLPDCDMSGCGASADCDGNGVLDECQVDPCPSAAPSPTALACGPAGILPVMLLLSLSLHRYARKRVNIHV